MAFIWRIKKHSTPRTPSPWLSMVVGHNALGVFFSQWARQSC